MNKKTLLSFTKMHGLGNDFVVIDNRQQLTHLSVQQIQFISDRHFGIGCDQVLLVENSTIEQVDFKYRIFNGDGVEVEQCGNGARCFARYVTEKRLTDKTTLAVETLAGIIYLYLTSPNNVKVNMGQPDFSPQKLPFKVNNASVIKDNLYQIAIIAKDTASIESIYTFSAVSMGNPHITLIVDQVKNYDVEAVGGSLVKHPLFPQGVNVGFMQIIDADNIFLRVYERGTGETLACGSGACAAVANGIQQGVLNHKVKVQLPAGNLIIQWDGDINQPVWMSGPASFVFEGQIEI